ncbi:FG-GAP repeat domain-containing protein [Pyxidicoccus sp. 3LFB2]
MPASRTVPVPLAATRQHCEVDFEGTAVQPLPGSLAHGDFNGDGKWDFAALDNNTVSVWRGLGNGRFLAPARQAPGPSMQGEQLASADLDGDGALDLIVLDSEDVSVLRVALGVGDGTFHGPVETAVAKRKLGEAAALLSRDLNADGLPEAVVLSGDGALFVLRHTEGGGLAPVRSGAPVPVGPAVAGDFNADGREDLLVVGTSLVAFHDLGPLGLVRRSLGSLGGAVSHAVSADFNRDGHLDLVAAVLEETETVLQLRPGDGTGHFGAPVPLARQPEALSALTSADVDGDGTADVLSVSGAASTATLLRGLGDGTFESRSLPVAPGQTQVFVADFDSSGGLDVLMSTSRHVSLLRDAEAPPASDFGAGFVLGDFDGDGWDDVASMTEGGVQVHLTRAEGGLVRRGPSPMPEGAVKLVAGRLDVGPTVDLLVLTDTGGTALTRSLVLLRGNGDGTFAAAEPLQEGLGPIKAFAGDVDGDEDVDLLVVGTRERGYERPLWHLRNAGDGTFAPAVEVTGPRTTGDMVLTDRNGDGRADLTILVSGYWYSSSFPKFEVDWYHGQEDGSLVRSGYDGGEGCLPVRLLVTDRDGDGKQDMSVSCGKWTEPPPSRPPGSTPISSSQTAGFVRTLWGVQAPITLETFPTPLNAMPVGLAARDLDGDGMQELLAAVQELRGVCGLPRIKGQTFPDTMCFGAVAAPDVVALVDVDHDGFPELLMGGGDAGTHLLRPR